MQRDTLRVPATVETPVGSNARVTPDNATSSVLVRDLIGVTAGQRVWVDFPPSGDAAVVAAI
jgi:hypothetical protein